MTDLNTPPSDQGQGSQVAEDVFNHDHGTWTMYLVVSSIGFC